MGNNCNLEEYQLICENGQFTTSAKWMLECRRTFWSFEPDSSVIHVVQEERSTAVIAICSRRTPLHRLTIRYIQDGRRLVKLCCGAFLLPENPARRTKMSSYIQASVELVVANVTFLHVG